MQQRSIDLTGQLVGHYRLLQPIASGGMATVYQAEDIHLQRQVAIKVFRPTQDQTGSFLQKSGLKAPAIPSGG